MRSASEKKRFKSGFEVYVLFSVNELIKITNTAEMIILATYNRLGDISTSFNITHTMALSSSD